MAFNRDERELWDVARSALPRVLVHRLPVVGRRIDGLWTGYVKIFQRAREVINEFFYGAAYISTSSDEWTDEHAKDANTRRQTGEDNDTLIARLRAVEDAVTKPAILARVQAVLDAAVGGTAPAALMTEIWQQGAYYQVVASWRTMYWGRGFRFGHLQPGLIVIILPYGTTTATAAAVDEAARQAKAGGFHHIIETRTTPP